MAGGRPKKYNTVEEMQEDIDSYFKQCDEKTEPYTITGLCLQLGLTRQSLLNYSKEDEFFDTIKEARLKVENCLEKNLYGTGVAGVIFNLKNNFGWKEQTENINVDMTYEDYMKKVVDVDEY